MGLLMTAATIGGLGLGFVLLIISLLTKKFWLTEFVSGAIAIWFAIYAVLLNGVSLSNSEKISSPDKSKEFCGLFTDCYAHTAITNLRTTKTIEDETDEGDFYIIKVKVFSIEVIGTYKIIESILIGNQDAIGHKRDYFKLDADSKVVNK
jgi:hypothetical protein